MESINYIAQLNEYVQKNRCDLKYDDVGSEGPAHIKTFTQRVILNGTPYPEGVGKTKKEARQNAAKHALRGFKTDPIQPPVSGLCLRDSVQSAVSQQKLTQPNYISWLNEHCQRNKVQRPLVEESTAIERGCATPCCRFVLDGKKYPTAFGITKKEAKEQAAKLAFQEICSNLPSASFSEVSSSHQTNESNDIRPEASGSLESMEVSTREPSLTELNYIGLLNTYCQKTMRSHDFSLVKKSGPAHCPQFFYRVVVDRQEYPVVEGKTAKEAKQGAAKEAWCALKELSDSDSKSAMSEGSSSMTEPKRATDNSSCAWIQFCDPSGNPKEEKLDNKPKIRLAPNFTNAPKGLSQENNPTKNTSASTTTTSRFQNDYDEIKSIGKGGFGRVFKARLKHLDQHYAVKVVRCKKNALQEAKVLAELQHPNIVRYYSSWIEESDNKAVNDSFSSSQSSSDASVPDLYIQMELCKTENLKSWIDDRNRSSTEFNIRQKDSRGIMRKIICGLEYIHSKNLIHRDIKPSNIMFALSEEVKIGDFGLVTEDSDDEANLLERMRQTGTKSFMAPEQSYKNPYDKKVDIFALGLVYFMMLWNMFGQERVETWNRIRKRKFPAEFKSTFPEEQAIIYPMLSEEPGRRLSAKEIQDRLEKSDPGEIRASTF